MRQFDALAFVAIHVHAHHAGNDVRFDGASRASRYDDRRRVGGVAARRHVGERDDNRR
jgi:hypothetical protein